MSSQFSSPSGRTLLSFLAFAALACVCTATVVPCPPNTAVPSGAKRASLAARGTSIFTSQAQRFNPDLPAFITEPAVYKTKIVPECYNASLYRIQVTYNVLGTPQEQRIDGREPDPKSCPKTAQPTSFAERGFLPTATTAPPLRCEPAKYRHAPRDPAAKALAEALFTRSFLPGMKKAKPALRDIYWCPGGVKRMTIAVGDACFKRAGATVAVDGRAYGPGKEVAKVIATVEYVCAQQARIRRGVIAATMPFTRPCAYEYTISDLWIQLG